MTDCQTSTESCGMSPKEWTILCKALRSAYPSQTVLPDEYSIKLWYSCLKDIPYEACNVAIQRLIMQSKFCPSISDVREKAAELTTAPVGDWSQGWAEVLRAVSKHGHSDPEGAYREMSETTAKVVKRLGWNEVCLSENTTSLRANFRDTYTMEAQRQRASNALPENFKKRMALIQKEAQIGRIEDYNDRPAAES